MYVPILPNARAGQEPARHRTRPAVRQAARWQVVENRGLTMTTMEWHKYIEGAGFQFCKARDGWALFDEDNRLELQGTWARTKGESVWLAVDKLGLKENYNG